MAKKKTKTSTPTEVESTASQEAINEIDELLESSAVTEDIEIEEINPEVENEETVIPDSIQKVGIKICKSNRFLSWVDDRWYETTSAMTQTFAACDIDDIFNKLETYCYVNAIDVVDENGNVIDHKGPQLLGNPLHTSEKRPSVMFSQRGLSMTPKMFKLRNPDK